MANNQPVVPEGHGMLTIPGTNGDTRLLWKRDDPAEVAEMREQFGELIKQGFGAIHSPTGRLDDAVASPKFDPESRTITMLKPPVGG